MQLVQEVGPSVGTKAMCEALSFPRSTYYRHRQPSSVRPRRPRPTPPRALDADERQRVLDVLHCERFVDQPPAEVVATLFAEGIYHCSVRTMYRILASEHEVRERRNQLRHPAYAKPELLATGPGQVWSWDITMLKAAEKWSYYYLYVLLDIFSRYVVGWLLAHREDGLLASELVENTYRKQGVNRGEVTIHADRGPAPTAKTLKQTFVDLGITPPHSRPRVSNDNPFSESQFKTMKYQPEYPDRFGSFQDAHGFCQRFFPWYNWEHHHSGIVMLTPGQVHHGQADEVLADRQHILDAAHAAHPERFVNGPPKVPSLPAAVWINPPEDKTQTEMEVH